MKRPECHCYSSSCRWMGDYKQSKFVLGMGQRCPKCGCMVYDVPKDVALDEVYETRYDCNPVQGELALTG